jgi:hypothetical protein
MHIHASRPTDPVDLTRIRNRGLRKAGKLLARITQVALWPGYGTAGRLRRARTLYRLVVLLLKVETDTAAISPTLGEATAPVPPLLAAE